MTEDLALTARIDFGPATRQADSVKQKIREVGTAADGVAGKSNRAAGSLRSYSGAAGQAASSSNRAGQSARRYGRDVDSASRKTQGLTASMRALVGVVAALGLAQVGRRVFAAGLAFERLQLKLDASGASFGFVSRLSNQLGLDLKSTASAFGGFSAAAQGTSLEGRKAEQIFASMAKGIRVMGLSASEGGRVMTALTQILAKGKLSAEELRQQLGEQFPPAIQLAAKALGVTTAQLEEMLQKGQILSEDFLPKFAAEVEKSFGDRAGAASASLEASINRIHNALFELSGLVVSTVGPTLAVFLDTFATGLDVIAREILPRLIILVARWHENVVRGMTRATIAVQGFGIKALDAMRTALHGIEGMTKTTGGRLLLRMLGIEEAVGVGFDVADFGLTAAIDKLRELQMEAIETGFKLETVFHNMAAGAVSFMRQEVETATDAVRELADASGAGGGTASAFGRGRPRRSPMPGELEERSLFDQIFGKQLNAFSANMARFGTALQRNLKRAESDTLHWADALDQVLQATTGIGGAFGLIASEISNSIRMAQQLATALETAGASKRTASSLGAIAGIGAGITNIGFRSGAFEGDRGTGRFGGQLSGDHADTGGDVGSLVGGVVGGAAAAAFTGGLGWAGGAAIGSAIGGVLGSIIGSFIKRGADEGLANIRQFGDEFLVNVLKDESGLGAILGDFGRKLIRGIQETIDNLGGEIVFLPDIGFKIRDDIISVFVNGITGRFEEMDDAFEFAIAEMFKTGVFTGLSPNVQAVLNEGVFSGFEEFKQALETAFTVDRLGIPDFELELRDDFEALRRLAREIERLGGSAQKVFEEIGRLSHEKRDDILGIVESEEEVLRRRAEIYNRHREQQLAGLEAEKADLLQQQQHLQAQFDLLAASVEVLGAAGELWLKKVGDQLDIVNARLADIDIVIGGFAPEITEEDIEGALQRKKGPGTRRQDRQALQDELDAIIRGGLEEVDQLVAEHDLRVAGLAERVEKLGISQEKWNAALDVLNDELLAELRDLGRDIVRSFGDTSLSQQFDIEELAEQINTLRTEFERFGLTAEQVEGVLSEFGRNLFADVGAQLAQQIGDERKLREFQQMRQMAEIEFMSAQIQAWRKLGLLSDEQVMALNKMLDIWRDQVAEMTSEERRRGGFGGGPGLRGGGAGGRGNRGGGVADEDFGTLRAFSPRTIAPRAANDNASMLDEIRRQIEEWQRLADPSRGDALADLSRRFAELVGEVERLGVPMEEFVAAFIGAVEALRRDALEPLLNLREEIRGGELGGLSPLEALGFAQGRLDRTFLEALANPTDAAAQEEFASAARDLIEQQKLFSGAGSAAAEKTRETILELIEQLESSPIVLPSDAAAASGTVNGVIVGGGAEATAALKSILEQVENEGLLSAQQIEMLRAILDAQQSNQSNAAALIDAIERLVEKLEAAA